MRELSLHILDIAQNSIRAQADKLDIAVSVDDESDCLEIIIEDNGHGMPQEIVEKVADPFVTSRTERRVGLGIPLFKSACEQTDGTFEVESCEGKGTTVRARFGLNHIDRAPLGDLALTVQSLVVSYPEVDVCLRLARNGKEFVFSSAQAREALEGVPISSPPVAAWILDHLRGEVSNVLGLD